MAVLVSSLRTVRRARIFEIRPRSKNIALDVSLPVELSSTSAPTCRQWTVVRSELHKLSARSYAKKLHGGHKDMLTALLFLQCHLRRRALLTSGLWTGLLVERLWRSARWQEREVVYVECHVLRV